MIAIKKTTTKKATHPAKPSHTEKLGKPVEKTARKPRAKKVGTQEDAIHKAAHPVLEPTTEAEPKAHAPKRSTRYVFAVGRRKTSVANVRLFTGEEKSLVNKKPLTEYFGNNRLFIEEIFKPLQLTGLEKSVYVYVNINGGGLHSQAQALAHGIALAVVKQTPEFRKVLKKNGSLTRDSRKKERKKPGLKRARRGPQWAKR